MTTESKAGTRLSLIEALVGLARVDLPFVGEYLYRAESLMARCITREAYSRLCAIRRELPRLVAALHDAAAQANWAQVRAIAEKASNTRARLDAQATLLPLADAVYGQRGFPANGANLALHGVIRQPTENVSRLQSTAIAQLRLLAEGDTPGNSFYRTRETYFQELRFDDTGGATAVPDTIELQKLVVAAAEKGDFDSIRKLTDVLPGKGSSHGGRLRPSRPRKDRARQLTKAFPADSAREAGELGFAEEMLPEAASWNDYLGCCCAERAELPDEPFHEHNRDSSGCTCGHPCPPEVAGRLRENLDLLLGRPSISSAGNRYLPWFGPETLLVETFPETDPNTHTPLLDRLGLPGRRGISRATIESALLTNGPRLLREIGLDPIAFEIVCIPFDAYLRLAPKYRWGQQNLWTHFDGYQVTRKLRLWALVGGYSEFGGAEDLCALGREYESLRLTARFAIVRRLRLFERDAAVSTTGNS